MSGSSSLVAFIALTIAVAGFSGLSLGAPVSYPEDSQWNYGLVREIVFEEGDHRSPCIVGGWLIFLNPSDTDVTFDLKTPVLWDVFFEVERIRWVIGQGEAVSVTVPAHGEYNATSFSFQASAPGYYEVEWDGLRRGVYVEAGELIPRIVTDKQIYDQYENGYLAFEYYNPKPYPVTFSPPHRVELWLSYNGVNQNTGVAGFIDWISDHVTVPPGGTFKIMKSYFTTPKAGHLTYTGMGTSKTLLVLPVER